MRKKTIEFFSIQNGIEKMYPVKHAKQVKPKWFKDEAKSYKEYKKTCPFAFIGRKSKRTTALKCPGITKTIENGFVVENCVDFIIDPGETPNEEKVTFRLPPWYHYGEDNFYSKSKYLEVRTGSDLFDIPPMPGCYNFHLKINLPWKVKAPKNTLLLEIPMLYGDLRSIIPVGGTLDPYISGNLNPLFWVAKTTTPVLIPAGTPLLQLIPIPRYNLLPNLVVRTQTEQEKKIQSQYTFLREHTFDTKLSYQNKVAPKLWLNED